MGSLWLGFRRHWFKGLTSVMGILGSLWLLTEITTALSPSFKDTFETQSTAYAIILAAVSAGVFIWSIYERRHLTFKIPTTDTHITLTFGDLFSYDENILIAVNEYFDGKLGHVVARHSVHGQFIERLFNSDEARFREEVDRALAGYEGQETARQLSPTIKYPIGTTAVLSIGSRKAFLFALSHTDLKTSKASATVSNLWIATAQAYRAVHEFGNGQPLVMPLIGNGRSSINLEPQHLLRLLVLSLVDYARKVGLPKQVTIVLSDDCFEALDIREIARDWRK